MKLYDKSCRSNGPEYPTDLCLSLPKQAALETRLVIVLTCSSPDSVSRLPYPAQPRWHLPEPCSAPPGILVMSFPLIKPIRSISIATNTYSSILSAESRADIAASNATPQ